jgi:tetrapyrrole methylase family protein/MazG family protein
MLRTSGFAGFHETVARLRGPGGCLWDQEQTHQSLSQGLIEETAEVLDALDADDMDALCEELGDLMLHVVMQIQIAVEEGEFTSADVIAGIEAKIRRRHPHVFGQERVSDVQQVLANWEDIKKRERGQEEARSALDGVPASLSSLVRADVFSRKAGRAGFEPPALERVLEQVQQEMVELIAADTRDERVVKMGDLLFAMVNWARRLDIDAETALRLAIRRFRQRFLALEDAARTRAGGISDLEREELEALWRRNRPDGTAEME